MDELVCAPMLSLVRSLGALFAFKLKDPLQIQVVSTNHESDHLRLN